MYPLIVTDLLEGLRGLVGLRSARSRMLVNAGNWVEVAERVWNYRRDQLTEAERRDLLARTDQLRQARRERSDPAKLKLLIEALEETLRQVGGRIYRKSALVENVEFFVVAAIVILGVRTYFIQPFKIPTNSMWPSYYGMTPQVYLDPATAPGPATQVLRFVTLGARHRELVAPASGPIAVPIANDGRVYYRPKAGRRWFIFPAQLREYTFYVADAAVHLEVPFDFDFDLAFREAFGVTAEQVVDAARRSIRPAPSGGSRLITLDRTAEAGRPFLSFDILTGDQLFVDRISYHFRRPRVGDGFVFRTGNIPGIALEYGDQYYIKRLVGVPGDTVEIHEPELWRNGRRIEGAAAFEKNAARVERFGGYGYAPESRAYLLRRGDSATVPPHSYLALGDNSANSADGRYWGYVPEKDVVGRPLFIYYPFTSRWGRSP